VVGKPLSLYGSIDVRLLEDRAALEAWLDETAVARPFLVEQALMGPEYSCEILVAAGRVVFTSLTEKVTSEPPYFVELEHHVPARLEQTEHDAVHALAEAVVTALGVKAGIMHLELRLEAGRPHVIEVAVRSPGDYIMQAVELALGVDLFGAVVEAACGDVPDVAPTRNEVACAWFPTTGEPGILHDVRGIDELESVEGVVESDCVPPGTPVHELRSSLDRCGSVILHAPDREELDRRLARAKSVLRLDVEPTPTG
jgi:biotin carboxylase